MQLPRAAIDEVMRYVRQVDPADNQTISALDCFRKYQDATFAYAGVDNAVKEKCQHGERAIYEQLSQRRTTYTLASSPAEYERVLHDARLVVQAEERYRSLENRDARDLYMAENVQWILDHGGPQTKLILWAHNTHVETALPMTKSMGSYLREQFGSEMISAGLSFYGGSFNAVAYNSAKKRSGDIRVQKIDAPPADSYEAYFHSAGMPRFVLDLRLAELQAGPELEWLAGPHPFRSIGVAYDATRPLDYCYQARLADEFDLVFFIDETTSSKLLSD